MPATFEFVEDNGTATGSPAKGTTRTGSRTECNWKNIDDSTTAYTSSPITAGNNSFTKYQAGHFTGTFTVIQNAKWAHTAGTFGTGLTLKGVVTSTYSTPATTTNSALTDTMTPAISIGSGASVGFSTTGPEDPSPTTTLTSAGYTSYLATQLSSTTSASGGTTATITLSLVYDEN